MGSHWGDGDQRELLHRVQVRGPLGVTENRLGRSDTRRPPPGNVQVLNGIGGTTVYRSSIGCRVTESGPLD